MSVEKANRGFIWLIYRSKSIFLHRAYNFITFFSITSLLPKVKCKICNPISTIKFQPKIPKK